MSEYKKFFHIGFQIDGDLSVDFLPVYSVRRLECHNSHLAPPDLLRISDAEFVLISQFIWLALYKEPQS